MDEIRKRTQRMKDELRRVAQEHEKASRASQGKSQIPLSVKLKQALPLVAIVIALYTFSFNYTKRLNRRQDVTQPDRVLSNVRDIFAPEDKTGERGPQMPELVNNFGDDLLLDDANKKW